MPKLSKKAERAKMLAKLDALDPKKARKWSSNTIDEVGMLWDTLAAVRLTTRCEFTPALAKQYHFVRCPSGKWTRTLGVPGFWPGSERSVRHIRGRTWEVI